MISIPITLFTVLLLTFSSLILVFIVVTKNSFIIIIIFINCNWVVTWWQ